MRISLYAHVWQAILMLMASVVAVAGSFVGFLRTGGGEQVLQQALVTILPHRTGGQAKFERLYLDVRASKLVVCNIQHSDVTDGQNTVAGIRAEVCEIGLDIWPRPDITSIHVRGMHELRMQVQKGFLQTKRAYPNGPPFPITFEDVDCELRLDAGPALHLEGIHGELRSSAVRENGKSGELIGHISLERLNKQPFRFRLASLADNRWEFRGTDLKIDTRTVSTAHGERPDVIGEALDPIELLFRSLLSGESGARGIISLQGVVQPAAEGRPFACEGRLRYQNLELRLPPANVQVGILPMFLEWLGGRKAKWPRLLIADTLRSGPSGCVAFHMEGNALNFACDEGRGSALVAAREGLSMVSLESLKGSVITDEEYRPQEMVLRSFLGDDLRGEIRMQRGKEGQGLYDVLVEPRATNQDPGQLSVPLWRFHSRVEDRGKLARKDDVDDDVLRFSSELSAMNFAASFRLLPPGMRDLSGRWRAKGRLTVDGRLIFDDISWGNGVLVFGGPEPSDPLPFIRQAYGPVLGGLKALWGGGPEPWRLENVTLHGSAEAHFTKDGKWIRTRLSDWRLDSGHVVYDGKSTDYGKLNLRVFGEYGRSSEHPNQAEIMFQASPKVAEGSEPAWWMRLVGILDDEGTGSVKWKEYGVPLRIHAERDRLDKRFCIGGLFSASRVYRERILDMRNNRPKKIEEKVLPQ